MKQKKITSTGVGYAIVAVLFIIMFVLNCLTPYIADDYTFSFRFGTRQPLTGLADVINSQIFHYKHWSGRFLIKILAQWFTTVPKLVFNVCNAGVFVGFLLVIQRLVKGRSRKLDPLFLLLAFIALWEVAPVFGQTNLWMCGSVNYLWATFFCCVALLPYVFYLQKPFAARRWMPFAAFFVGLVAGWSSENTSAGMLVALVLCTAFAWISEKKPQLWMLTGFGGALIGFALLILAPGNYHERQDSAADPRSPITVLAVRFLTALEMLWKHGAVLVVLFAFLYCFLWLQKPKAAALCLPAIFFLAGLGANFAMVLSPVYYERSTHGVFAYLILACLSCLAALERPTVRKIAASCTAALLCVFAVHFVQASYDILSFHTMRSVRETLILEQIEEGQTEIATYAIEPYTRWCGGYGLPDLRHSPDDWVCSDTALYYGVDKLWATNAQTYPFPGQTNAAWEEGIIAN